MYGDPPTRDDVAAAHLLIEVVKLAFADGLAHVAEPSAIT